MSDAPLLTRPVGDRDGVVRWTLSDTHPRRLACVLLALDLVIVVASAVVIRVVAPGMSSLTAALIVTAVLAVVVTILVWRISGFREAGFTGPRTWRNLHLLILPTVLAFIPLRIGTIWPLMVLHTSTDLFAAVGALPKIPILVGQDIVLLVVGLWLLRGNRAPQAVSVATNDDAAAVNEVVREQRFTAGAVDDTHVTHGSDALRPGVGDQVRTRLNMPDLGPRTG